MKKLLLSILLFIIMVGCTSKPNLHKNPFAIEHIQNPSEKQQLIAVQRLPDSIKYIKNPSESVQLVAVKENGLVIKHIMNPSREVKLAAVKQTSLAIKHIPNPSEELQLVAVKKYGLALQYINNPSKVVQLNALKEDSRAIKYIKNPSETFQLEAVKGDPESVKYIKNPTQSIYQSIKETQLTELKNNPSVITKFKSLTREQLRLFKGKKIILHHPLNYRYENEHIEISTIKDGAYIVLKNKTNKFLKILRISFYNWDDEVDKRNPITISPQSSSEYWYPWKKFRKNYRGGFDQHSGYTYTFNTEKVRFGVALEYSLGESIFTKSIYHVNDYSVFDLYDHEQTTHLYSR